MQLNQDLERVYSNDPSWYRKIWTLDIKEMAWVEETQSQIDFLLKVLNLKGNEKVLDLACGFGRHALELANRGCQVTGVDITPAYIEDATKEATQKNLPAKFICADLRELNFKEEFDIVLNLADGAIGYLENDEENLKIFDIVSAALKPDGKHVMDVCNGGYAAKHFPKRNWVFGKDSLSLADFDWDPEKSLMYYGGLTLKCDEPLQRPTSIHCNPTRLYNLTELKEIFQQRGMTLQQAYGDFDLNIKANDDVFQMQVFSKKKLLNTSGKSTAEGVCS